MLGCLAVAAAIAAGCGGGNGGDGDPTSIDSGDGPLAWLPAETWAIASVDASVKDIDRAIATLERLPIWSLAEIALPADDGAGLRRALLQAIAKESKESGGNGVTAKRLEAAFGDRFGMAIVDNDLEALDSSDAEDLPFVVWLAVDDVDAATAALVDLTAGKDTESEHEGRTTWTSKRDDFAFTVDDELAVITSSRQRLEQLIDVREGDDSLARDKVARAVIEAGIGDAFVGLALQTDPLLEAVPALVEHAAAESEDPTDAAKAAAIADDLGPVLESAAVDGLVADWFAGSATVDATGLRLRGAWSNPRELAEPKVGSRELVERMPAGAPTASAMVSDGTMLGRVQDAWTETRDAYELDLRSYVAECEPAMKVFCELGIEAVLAVLEDKALADALEDAGPRSMAYVQDIGATLATIMPPKGATARPARAMEVATSGDHVVWAPTAELAASMRRAGLVVLPSPGGDVSIRVIAGSPLDAWLRRFERSQTSRADTGALALSLLRSPRGIEIKAEDVDGIRVLGFPQNAPSKVVPALRGDTETIGESSTYRDVIAAAKPPAQVGTYGWVDTREYFIAILSFVAGSEPDFASIIPTIRNNLAKTPGIIWWSSREQLDGEEVGVAEMAMPILE